MDHLLERGVRCVTVIDVSGAALRRARERLPHAPVTWIEADVTGDWTAPAVDFWHDRAAFHFLTASDDRLQYIQALERTLKAGGQAIIATFSPEGPSRCSGLPVARYSPETLSSELGPEFRLVESVAERHHTPAGAVQAFTYNRFVFRGRQG